MQPCTLSPSLSLSLTNKGHLQNKIASIIEKEEEEDEKLLMGCDCSFDKSKKSRVTGREFVFVRRQ
jgi:hypothetical protein